MPYEYPKYPGNIFTDTDYPNQEDDKNWIKDWLVNALKEELQACLTELGTNPKGSHADVKTRLDVIETLGYHDRGDPAAWDKILTDLTTDATWRDLDLSGVCPEGIKAIQIRVEARGQTPGGSFGMRKKGNENDYNVLEQCIQVADKIVCIHGTIPCDTNRKIQYNAADIDWTSINIVVKGWFT
jgi:hypothetical protein